MVSTGLALEVSSIVVDVSEEVPLPLAPVVVIGSLLLALAPEVVSAALVDVGCAEVVAGGAGVALEGELAGAGAVVVEGLVDEPGAALVLLDEDGAASGLPSSVEQPSNRLNAASEGRMG